MNNSIQERFKRSPFEYKQTRPTGKNLYIKLDIRDFEYFQLIKTGLISALRHIGESTINEAVDISTPLQVITELLHQFNDDLIYCTMDDLCENNTNL